MLEEEPVQTSESVEVPRDGGWLQLRMVPDDNSCLFSAVGVIFEGSIHAAPKLRQGTLNTSSLILNFAPEWKGTLSDVVVADAIRGDPETYSDVVLGWVRP